MSTTWCSHTSANEPNAGPVRIRFLKMMFMVRPGYGLSLALHGSPNLGPLCASALELSLAFLPRTQGTESASIATSVDRVSSLAQALWSRRNILNTHCRCPSIRSSQFSDGNPVGPVPTCRCDVHAYSSIALTAADAARCSISSSVHSLRIAIARRRISAGVGISWLLPSIVSPSVVLFPIQQVLKPR